jgi:hypothetical protein
MISRRREKERFGIAIAYPILIVTGSLAVEGEQISNSAAEDHAPNLSGNRVAEEVPVPTNEIAKLRGDNIWQLTQKN